MQPEFTHILRVLNTNIQGTVKIPFALTSIRGVGRRYAFMVLQKAGVDPKKRAGELSTEEIDRVVEVMQNPLNYKIPAWFLNRQRDIRDGKTSQEVSNHWDTKIREDLEVLKKMRCHRGLRHYWGLKVRGQHTKTTSRRGRSVGVVTKKK